MNELVIKDEGYGLLLEEIKATLIEKSFEERMVRIEMYHLIGASLRNYGRDITMLTKEVSKDLNLSERSLWSAIKFYDTYPTVESLESLPDGKATSWNKIKKLLSGEKKEDTIDLSKVAKGIIKRYGLEDAVSIADLVLTYASETPSTSSQEPLGRE